MRARRWLPWALLGWLALAAAELALASLLDADALAAAMTAPRPSVPVFGGLALVLLRVARFVVVPSAVTFVGLREALPRLLRCALARPHSTGQGP